MPLPLPDFLERLGAGLLLAAAVAALAWRARLLAPSGAAAAALVGAAAVGAGWGWGALLVLYFVLAAGLSRVGAATKARRTGAVVAKGGARDAVQVLANGLPFALAALAAIALPDPRWALAAAGALAASAADTWATEIGTLLGGTPRSLRTGRPVPVGSSGGVTVAGSLAAVAGALAIGVLARLLGFPPAVVPAALAGGLAGAWGDSLLGATLQARRHCPRCDAPTERNVHPCGERTRPAGGLPWLDNDLVNLLAATLGGATALLWA